ncbi:thiosulfate oxidation carrier protein SoxY [Hyphomonas sp.]|uniref:thiosulfate oxidation carrier protein SoxY n=1 Tax=Hyphomonas sp. TaxID=87 RepID=UPI0030F7F176
MPDHSAQPEKTFSRRALIRLGAGSVLIAATPLPAFATPDDVKAAQQELFGSRVIREGRVTLKLPAIAENGYSVPFSVDIDSPMTEEDHVRQIAIFSPRNPIANVARFQFGPRAGRAAVATRIRLGGTQAVQAVAEMNDGSLWSGSAQTVVTLAACVVL